VSLPDELVTRRLRLRRPSVADAPAALIAWAGDPEVARWLAWEPHATAESVAGFLASLAEDRASGAGHDWVIEALTDGLLLGSIGLRTKSAHHLEVGFVVRRDAWGEGIAGEALDAVVAAALALPGIVRVEARCHPDHHASRRVLAKAGFALEGRLRRVACYPNLGDEPQDALVFARLA
jgi:RimJ/RimL family protein N-acetyltransferase